jgi:S1-C subfamily serine protease
MEQLHNLAESITVKVRSRDNWGSGILIQQQGQVYTVLTNKHVLAAGKPYRVETPNGQVYFANLSGSIRFGGNDLALLQFRSPYHTYAVASLGTTATLRVGDEVFAGGFPFARDWSDSMGFVFTTGQVSLLLDRALVGGYQVGYTNEIQKGMSGGPILNRQGEVVGLNGMHKHPLWGNPYIFKDGSTPNFSFRELMTRYSWGIPSETFAQLVPQLPDPGACTLGCESRPLNTPQSPLR